MLNGSDVTALAEAVLTASYRKGIDLYTVDELAETLTEAVKQMAEQYPQNRVRLKAIGGEAERASVLCRWARRS